MSSEGPYHGAPEVQNLLNLDLQGSLDSDSHRLKETLVSEGSIHFSRAQDLKRLFQK